MGKVKPDMSVRKCMMIYYPVITHYDVYFNNAYLILRCFIGGSLESPKRLLLAFCPEIWGGGKDLQMILLLLNELQLELCGQSEVVGILKPYLLFKKF